MVQLTHQWLTMNRKSKNIVTDQSMKLGVSVLSRHWNSKEVGSKAVEGRNGLARAQTKSKSLLLLSLHRLPAKDVAKIRGVSSQLKRSGSIVCLPASKMQIKSTSSYFKLSKIPAKVCSPFGDFSSFQM